MSLQVHLLFLALILGQLCLTLADKSLSEVDTIHDFNATDIDGHEVSFGRYKGNVLLVVNVASQCSLTESNYEQLNQLYEKFSPRGFRIAAFPSNQFLSQEPGDAKQIKAFTQQKKAQFDIYDKVDVNGDNAHVIYKWLKSKLGGTLTDSIKWNFTKFLLDCQGHPVKRYGPMHAPKDIESDIVAELKKCTKTESTSREL